MDIQELFYWTATVALILLGVFIISLFAFLLSFVTQHATYTMPKIGVQALMPSDGGR